MLYRVFGSSIQLNLLCRSASVESESFQEPMPHYNIGVGCVASEHLNISISLNPLQGQCLL